MIDTNNNISNSINGVAHTTNINITNDVENNNGRHSESPARTIDSHDSTTGSMDTIVDRTAHHHHQQSHYQHQHHSQEEMMHTAIEQTATLVVMSKPIDDDLKKPKLISHEEFKKQLEETMASRAATLDSRISKKQRFPPELIKDDGSSIKSSKSLKKKSYTPQSSTACCSAFPVQIILGLLQLVLAISLVALGSLLIVREASLSTAGCGIWTGLIAAVTGSLGVVGLRKTQTSFLALSLVCIASSTLALAISGIGLCRDINRSKERVDLLNANSEISAASGLIFALFLHFVVSVISVYRCALQICSRHEVRRSMSLYFFNFCIYIYTEIYVSVWRHRSDKYHSTEELEELQLKGSHVTDESLESTTMTLKYMEKREKALGALDDEDGILKSLDTITIR
uniref:Uncharacterized protein n=1 Tax=Glossina pallidipes TaxID=7398 RepID=A0A1B0AK55_GLOPL